MKIYKYINILLSTFMSLMVISCEIEEITEDIADSGMVHKRFTAVIEGGEVTKTLLDENVEDGVRNLLWDPGDVIGIGIQGKEFCKFTNVRTDAAADGFFEGSISEVSNYFAIYPWKENLTMTTELTLEIPSRQTYRENSFDIDMAPMVGRGNNGESIYFQNLCGVLAIPMKGADIISSITLSAKDSKGNPAFISGDFSVDMGYEDFPYPMPVESSQTKVILDCGSGVQLDSETETYFHIVLPPGKYYGLDLLIATSDGKFMTKSTENTLTLRRSMITKTAVLEYQENVGAEVFTDLSLRGNANCYIVSSKGFYIFDASTIGNGTFGLVQGAGFHTDDVNISPVSAEILWSVPDNVIDALSFDMSVKEVRFSTSGVEGNALVVVKDADGTILWSWHIWATETPVDQTYVNSAGTFDVQDRNLGATRADRGTGEEWMDAMGLLYQWGRKDPFAAVFDGVNLKQELFDLEWTDDMSFAIKNPTRVCGYWDKDYNIHLWQNIQKTIYDPCPVGYRVVDNAAWSGFAIDGATSYNHGWDIMYDGQNRSYYPQTHRMVDGKIKFEDSGFMWSSCSYARNTKADALHYYDSSIYTFGFNIDYGYPVRCMKDKGHVDIAMPFVDIHEIIKATTELVQVNLDIVSNAAEVTEFGIIYGTSSGVSAENGTKVQGIEGENSIEISGLAAGTKYYVVAYATNTYGTTFSKEELFWTKFESLSKSGTSNCYIVPTEAYYSFDASVKGNSNESVGSISSVEVLWATKGEHVKTNITDIISGVELNGNQVGFTTTGVEGNALIAVKDSSGKILWSWHIWCTDVPVDHRYENTKGTFIVQDRHLGAIRGDKGTGDQWKESVGLEYQWGRKDPLVGRILRTAYHSSLTVTLTIQNPTFYYPERVSEAGQWLPDQKTMYDPCPAGYRVAPLDIWDGFSISKTYGSFSNGWHFYYNDSEYAWYPVKGRGSSNGYTYWSDSYMTSSSPSKYGLYFSSSSVSPNSTNTSENLDQLRCMKE